MLQAIQRLLKHSSIYAIGSAIQGIAGLILIPVYTKSLPISDYGQYELINTVLLILVNIMGLGLASAYIKSAERDVKTKQERKTLATTALVIFLTFATTLTVILALLTPQLTQLLNFSKTEYLYLALGIAYSTLLMQAGLTFLRANEQSARYTVTTLIKFFAMIGLNTYFILSLKLGITGILLGVLSSNILAILSLIPVYFKNTNKSFSFPLLKKLLAFGIAIIPSGLAMWVMDLIDRYYLNYYNGFEAVGIYSLAYKFGVGISILLVAPFQLAWPTIAFSIAENKDAKETFSRILTYYTALAALMALAMSAVASDVIPIISTAEYLTAATIVPLITFSYLFLGAHFIIVVGLHIQDKSKLYPILIVIPAIANIILNSILVPRYGMLGAAITTFSSFGIMALLTALLVQKYYTFRYEWSRIVKIIVAIGITVIALHFVPKPSQELLHFATNLGLVSIFPISLLLLGFINKGELEYIKKLPTLLKK